MRGVYISLIFAALAVGVAFGLLIHGDRGIADPQEVMRDTVVIRDTVRVRVPVPEMVEVVRYDTLTFRDTTVVVLPGDTIVLPVEQKTYAGEEYKAVVEGFRPRLVSMEVYPRAVNVTERVTVMKHPRWVISAGPGIGMSGSGLHPYLGVSAGFVIWAK